MKYIIDLDALKSCLNLLYKPFRNDGEDLVYLADVQEMIDRFPKEGVEIKCYAQEAAVTEHTNADSITVTLNQTTENMII